MRKQAFLAEIVIGLLAGSIVAGICYWLVFPKGVHLSRVEAGMAAAVLAALASAWAHYKSSALQMVADYDQTRGYYRMHVGNYDICLSSSKERVPKPLRPSGVELIGKAHCLIDDQFWVWRETCSHGTANVDDTQLA